MAPQSRAADAKCTFGHRSCPRRSTPRTCRSVSVDGLRSGSRRRTVRGTGAFERRQQRCSPPHDWATLRSRREVGIAWSPAELAIETAGFFDTRRPDQGNPRGVIRAPALHAACADCHAARPRASGPEPRRARRTAPATAAQGGLGQLDFLGAQSLHSAHCSSRTVGRSRTRWRATTTIMDGRAVSLFAVADRGTTARGSFRRPHDARAQHEPRTACRRRRCR